MTEAQTISGSWSNIHGSTCQCGGEICVYRDYSTLQVTDALCTECLKSYEPSEDIDKLASILSGLLMNEEPQLSKEEIGYEFDCQDCGCHRVMDIGEVSYYNGQGYHMPKRCPNCVKKKKLSRAVPSSHSMHRETLSR